MQIQQLAKEHLGDELPEKIVLAIQYDSFSEGMKQFVHRVFKLMRNGGFTGKDFGTIMVWQLNEAISKTLVDIGSDWIPSITSPARHNLLDKMMLKLYENDGNSAVFYDIGCGYPPFSTVDTSKNLKNWTVIGSDPVINCDLLFDINDNYAMYNESGKLLHVQPGNPTKHAQLYQEKSAGEVREMFQTYYNKLKPGLTVDYGEEKQTVEETGFRLVRNMIRDFEKDKLSFHNYSLHDPLDTKADIIRCMNVMVYFDKSEREKAISSFGKNLKETGMAIWGTNNVFGLSQRFFVQNTERNEIVFRFVFGLDHVRSFDIMTFFSLKDDDIESKLLMKYINILRSDKTFMNEYNSLYNTLIERSDIFCFHGEGFLDYIFSSDSSVKFLKFHTSLVSLFDEHKITDSAVSALISHGINAEMVSPGHISVEINKEQLLN